MAENLKEKETGHVNDLNVLVSNFMEQVKQSDWLAVNTAEKWESENPQLAKDYRSALNRDNLSHSDETKKNSIRHSKSSSSETENEISKSLMTMMTLLKQDINSSDWLEQQKVQPLSSNSQVDKTVTKSESSEKIT